MDPEVERYNREVEGATAPEIISWCAEKFGERVAFASSLGAEDQVITEMISNVDQRIKIFTLDTGRLFQETYDLLEITREKYALNIEVCFPDPVDVEEMVNTKGINLFYRSVENRKLCCFIRKSESLTRVLQEMDAWICGIRREQSPGRAKIHAVEWDDIHQKVKINPLVDWTTVEVWDYIRAHGIPYNTLHDKGYASIGCLPCTRAIEPGENIRAGRWWWELSGNKECGLHAK